MENVGSFMFVNVLVGGSSWTHNNLRMHQISCQYEDGDSTHYARITTFPPLYKYRCSSLEAVQKLLLYIHDQYLRTEPTGHMGPKEDEKAGQCLLSSVGLSYSDNAVLL